MHGRQALRTRSPRDLRRLLGAFALTLFATAALAACHAPRRGATERASDAPNAVAPDGAVAGIVTMGTVDESGTLEIRILPHEPERIEEARRAVAAEPASSAAHAALGDELARQGHLDESIAAYTEAARLAPEDPVAQFRLGLTLHVAGDLESALRAYQETARLAPESAWAHAAIAVVHLRLGDSVAALAEYRIVRSLDPELAEGLFEIIAEAQELQQARQGERAASCCG